MIITLFSDLHFQFSSSQNNISWSVMNQIVLLIDYFSLVFILHDLVFQVLDRLDNKGTCIMQDRKKVIKTATSSHFVLVASTLLVSVHVIFFYIAGFICLCGFFVCFVFKLFFNSILIFCHFSQNNFNNAYFLRIYRLYKLQITCTVECRMAIKIRLNS